jgi:hypothetical protein
MTRLPAAERYAPLVAFLQGLSPATTTVTLALAEIEHLIGQVLPAAASTKTWWTARRGWDRQLRP